MRDCNNIGSKAGDVYSFAIILHELLFRRGPFSIYSCKSSAKTIVNLVKNTHQAKNYRPDIEVKLVSLYIGIKLTLIKILLSGK